MSVVTGQRACDWLPPVSALERRLWKEMDKQMSGLWAADAKVLCIGFGRDEIADLDGYLRAAGASAIACSPLFQWGGERALVLSSFSHVLVALDGESESFALFDLLVQLRKALPTTVVIFVDYAAHADDLTSERAAICDATLKGPVTEAQLRNGFAAAARNIVSRVGRGDEALLHKSGEGFIS